jgi:alkylated DNA repair dioxygenase AlkB
MDAFISRKKRNLSPEISNPLSGIAAVSTPDQQPDDDSTDFKLAILSSLHPFTDTKALLDILLAYDGDTERASASLVTAELVPRKPSTIGYQSSLSTFISPKNSNLSKRSKLLSKKGTTLHLYSPEDIASHTPCSIIHNFLPAEEANALLEELLEEATSYERTSFKLFDNVVQSPHTACFYVENYEEQERQRTEYIYNGGRLTVCLFPNSFSRICLTFFQDVRQLTPQMRRVSPKVQEAVNAEVQKRIRTHYPDGKKLNYQSPEPWEPNAAFVNCYSGAAESVGYHCDQLTYLGPRAIIGSISLGVAREFRVRKIVPQDSDANSKTKDEADTAGQIAIHLPHNSLLVMHAEMQEEWKHSIAPAQTIGPHPIAGNKRINITYRDYKEYLHPRFTPKCRCDVPAVLRVVQRKKENLGRYFWMCHAGNLPEKDKEGCSFFEWAIFDEDGIPVWKNAARDGKRDLRIGEK